MTEGDLAIRTVRSLATMLGWVNVPPQASLEHDIRALKANRRDWLDASRALDELAAPDSSKTLAQRVRDEFHDFQMVIKHCSETYDYFSRSRISKPNTLPREVFSEAEALAQEDIAEALAEARQEWERPDLVERITSYLGHGGFFNPEMMDHDKVRNLLLECREALEAPK